MGRVTSWEDSLEPFASVVCLSTQKQTVTSEQASEVGGCLLQSNVEAGGSWGSCLVSQHAAKRCKCTTLVPALNMERRRRVTSHGIDSTRQESYLNPAGGPQG